MFSRVLFSSKGQCYRTLIRPHEEEKELYTPALCACKAGPWGQVLVYTDQLWSHHL